MDLPRLTAELERALLRALAAAWRDVDANHFRRQLRPPIFRLADGRAFLGRWLRDERTIEMSRALVTEASWGVVVEVLKHEMAHQFVHEVLGVVDETAHGPAFRGVCERLGIDGRAAGLPSANPSSEAPGPEVAAMRRIGKLLALGESPNAHEAEAAMAEAQRLMLKHNLAAPPARAGYGFRHLGAPTGRVAEHERIVANLLEQHFFVECIWVPVWRALDGKRGSVLEVCGTPENLDMAEYVHGFLGRTGERLWREYKKERGLDGDRDRRTWLAGAMEGFREKLAAGQAQAKREGLVWVGDAELSRYFKRRHPAIRWTRYAGAAENGARSDGKAAGRGIVLHRPVGGGAPSGPRLLPGRSS